MAQLMFHEKLRDLRKKFGYTQADVSYRLNIQRQTYCNYENASRTPPLEIIVALSELYNVSVDYLVSGSIPAISHPTAQKSPLLSTVEKKLLEDFSCLTPESQKEVLNFIYFKMNFPS